MELVQNEFRTIDQPVVQPEVEVPKTETTLLQRAASILTSPFSKKEIGQIDICIDVGSVTSGIYACGGYGHVEVITPTPSGPVSKTVVAMRSAVAIRKRKPHEKRWFQWFRDWRKRQREKSCANNPNNKSVLDALKEEAKEYDEGHGDIVAAGEPAFQRWGRHPDEIDIVWPVVNGNIASIRAYIVILRHLIRFRFPGFTLSFETTRGEKVPRIFIGVPRNADLIHIRTIANLIRVSIGAEPIIVWEQFAAAVGAQFGDDNQYLPWEDGSTSFTVADFGGGTLDMIVVAKGNVIYKKSYEGAGVAYDQAIREGIAKGKKKGRDKIDIGELTAVRIKEKIGSAMPFDDEKDTYEHPVWGSSCSEQAPADLTITPRAVRKLLEPRNEALARNMEQFMEDLHKFRRVQEVQGDIKTQGIYLTGGSARLHGLAPFLSSRLGIPIHLANNLDTTVLDGLRRIQQNPKLLALGQVSY